LAVSNVWLGIDVVVHAVNAVPEARAGWRQAAHRGGAELVQVETWLPDRLEHRRRVEARTADIPGHEVPSWDEVEAQHWTPWDTSRDGPPDTDGDQRLDAGTGRDTRHPTRS
jgi:predicted kinase